LKRFCIVFRKKGPELKVLLGRFDVSSGDGGKIDDHGSRLHALDHVLLDQKRSSLA
jgi:hypothetical protein